MMYSPDDLDALDGHPFDPDRPVSREVLVSSARDGVLRSCREAHEFSSASNDPRSTVSAANCESTVGGGQR